VTDYVSHPAFTGFGRSGYGSYGYTSDANLTYRRIG